MPVESTYGGSGSGSNVRPRAGQFPSVTTPMLCEEVEVVRTMSWKCRAVSRDGWRVLHGKSVTCLFLAQLLRTAVFHWFLFPPEQSFDKLQACGGRFEEKEVGKRDAVASPDDGSSEGRMDTRLVSATFTFT